MRNRLCWAPSGVVDVINPEAEVVSPAVFRAVHTPCDLRVSGPVGTSFQKLQPENFASVSQEALLEDFLRNDAPYRRMAVFGRSGSGKSHLIHWLKLQLPSTKGRLVVVVPKTGTSLRSILESLIDELPPEKQTVFREALSRSGEAVATRVGQKQRLLFEIAYAIGELKPGPDSAEPDLERELIKVVPYLFDDLLFRDKYFYRDGNIIADLVDHVFAAPTAYRPVDQRRSFTLDDLPVDVLDLKDASALARQALQFLHGVPQAPAIAVDLVNRALEIAIGRTLSFTGDRLVSLMEDLRRHLRSEQRELVLLIEDFARVQGLDRALLQAMIVQGGGPDDDLCNMRWAIAVTTGFFEQVIDTVYTRISHFVNMDRSAGRRAGDRMDRDALSEFAGPYLNAARLGAERLRAMDGVEDHTLENACESCLDKNVCHEAFGATQHGHGLYPFTKRALWIMAHRADEQVEEAFNPRTLQTGVLTPVLEGAGPTIPAGSFPPASLLSRLGGYRDLNASSRDDLRRRAGTSAERLGTLLELWDGSGEVVNLPDAMRAAWDVPTIPDAKSFVDEPELDEPKTGAGEGPAPTDVRTPLEKELEAWAKGGSLDRAVNVLRPLMFEAIGDSIDWDGLGVERSRFASAEEARAFRRRSIQFVRQGTTNIPLPVVLQIPRKDATQADFDRAAVALAGLVRASREGSWDFVGGTDALSAYLQCLKDWRDDVTRQLRALVAPSDTWSHVDGPVELLALGCVLQGRIRADGELTSDVSALLEGDWSPDIPAVTPELTRLYQQLLKEQPDLRRNLRALSSAGKGGVVGNLVNPGPILAALRRLRAANWRLTQSPPAAVEYEPLRKAADVYKRVADALEPAAQAERTARVAWLDEMQAAFGEEPKRATILSTLGAAREALTNASLGSAAGRRLDEALAEFAKVQFDDAISAARALRASDDAVSLLPAYARGRGGAVQRARQVADAAETFLTQAKSHLDEQISRQSAQEQAVASDIALIEASLRQIRDGLDSLEPDHAA